MQKLLKSDSFYLLIIELDLVIFYFILFYNNLSYESIPNLEKTPTDDKLEDTLDDEELLKLLRDDFCLEIEKINTTVDAIKNQFLANKDMFSKVISEIRLIEPNTVFSGQPISKIEENFKKILQLNENLFAVNSTGDGSCLYHSISLILFGSENFSFLIKLCSIFMLFENEDYFRKVSFNATGLTFENLILSSCKKYQYGNNLNIISIEIMLNRNIFCYNQSETISVLYHFSERIDKNPILIGLIFSLYGKIYRHFFPLYSLLEKYVPIPK